MRTLIAIVLVLFGLSVIIAGGVEIYAADDDASRLARASYILGGVVGAGLVISGPGVGRNLPWARLLAMTNLSLMTGLSILNAFYLKGHVHATHHATRALLALFLILSIVRLRR